MDIHEIYKPFQLLFRRKRMREFVRLFSVNGNEKIIDVGGTVFNWKFIDSKPSVTLINIGVKEWKENNFQMIEADGTKIPFDDNSFDICFSNSVIEHVGNWDKCVSFSREIRRVAPKYYVQTPNKWFPIEPHLITFFLHWFPMSARRKLVRLFSVWGLVNKPNQQEIDHFLQGINLLSVKQMKILFPDAKIKKERVLFLTKSIIAVRF
jgi:hypothetical protein